LGLPLSIIHLSLVGSAPLDHPFTAPAWYLMQQAA